ncbi:MAG: leucine-rich repeat protein [Muribaculum sp.]|nr:leucine-rich repeat protein [Muribaculum sp.]
MKNMHCLNCMETYEGSGVCPHCGFDNGSYQSPPYVLGPNTILHGKYLIGRVLGQGGFGITYMGFDLSLEIKVAIKEYFPMNQSSRDHSISNELHWNTSMASGNQWQNGCESFLKEARKMAKISTIPEIVSVRETFNENNTAYIVMDYVEGINLKNWLGQNGPMDFDTCVNLLLPLMIGLDKVHKQGLIHRDISPDNIMLQPDGQLRLLDLGAAKDLSTGNQASSQLVTKHGFSPLEQYMEQGGAGPWTDVYALCATIYYCITGALVPNAPDRLDNEALDFTKVRRTPLTKQQMDILTAGLALKKEKRTQSVSALVDQLKGTVPPPKAAQQASGKQPSGKRLPGKWLAVGIGLAAAFCLVVILVAGSLLAGGRKQKAVAAVEVEMLGCTNGNLHQGANYARIPKRYQYYTDKEWNLYVVPYDEEDSTFWIGTDGEPVDDEAGYINVGEDKIYFLHDELEESGNPDSLMRMDFDGSNVETLLSEGNYTKMQYAKLTDGKEYLYYLKEDDNPEDLQHILCRYDIEEGTAQEVLAESVYWFNLSGDKLYYISISEDDIYESAWKCAGLDGQDPSVLNDSNNLVSGYIEDDVAYLFSLKEEVLHEFTLEGEQKREPLVTPYDGCSVYGDGWIYYANTGSSEVHRLRPDGSNDTLILEGNNIVQMCYVDSSLWLVQGKIVNSEYVLQQTYLVYKDGSNLIAIEDEYTDNMPAGLEYKVEDSVLLLQGYTGGEPRIVIPWEVDEKPITNINRAKDFPKDVDLYCYPQENGIAYELTEDKKGVVITGCGGGLTDGYPFIALPATIDDLPVVRIGDEAFKGSESLQGIILPEGLKEIGEDAFRSCGKLAYVQLPDTIKSIEKGAFVNASSLTEIILPEGLETLGTLTFSGSGLKEVQLPTTLEITTNSFASSLKAVTVADGAAYYVENGAVYDSSRTILIVPSATSGTYVVPDGTVSVGTAAFMFSDVSAVYLPADLKKIEVGGFGYCDKLKAVYMEEGVESIQSIAFIECTELQDITIPKSVKSIGTEAFAGCTSLESVTISRDCEVAEDAFDSTTKIKYYD